MRPMTLGDFPRSPSSFALDLLVKRKAWTENPGKGQNLFTHIYQVSGTLLGPRETTVTQTQSLPSPVPA